GVPTRLTGAGVEHGLQGALLGGLKPQAPHVFAADPHLGVGAAVRRARRLPGGRVLVALGLVDVVGDGDELGVAQVVGEALAAAGGPGVGTGSPGLGQGHDVVDVHVGGVGPGGSVVGAVPASGYRCAGAVDDDAGAVALEDRLAGVAASRHGDPVGEQRPGVAGHGSLTGADARAEFGL